MMMVEESVGIKAGEEEEENEEEGEHSEEDRVKFSGPAKEFFAMFVAVDSAVKLSEGNPSC